MFCQPLGDLPLNSDGDAHWKIQLLREAKWVWLKLKLTPKGDHTKQTFFYGAKNVNLECLSPSIRFQKHCPKSLVF